ASDASGPSSLPRRVASTLRNTTQSLRRTLEELQAASAEVTDEVWSERLRLFISKVGDALEIIPSQELERVLEEAPPRVGADGEGLAAEQQPSRPDLFEAAGFVRVSPIDLPVNLAGTARGVAKTLRVYANETNEFAEAVLDSPQTRLSGVEDELHHALA